jgi:ABC-2 type transport system permease protein
MLPPVWQAITLFNPVVYIINGFRWTFHGTADVDPVLSFSILATLLAVCLALAHWMIRTGWRLRH